MVHHHIYAHGMVLLGFFDTQLHSLDGTYL